MTINFNASLIFIKISKALTFQGQAAQRMPGLSIRCSYGSLSAHSLHLSNLPAICHEFIWPIEDE
jgi:hypothetical protein